MSANEIAQKTYINDSARDGHPTANGIEAWMEKARDLAPVIERYRDQAEQERRLPRPIFEAMRDAGFLRIWLPEALGGFAAGEETVARVVEEVSRHERRLSHDPPRGERVSRRRRCRPRPRCPLACSYRPGA